MTDKTRAYKGHANGLAGGGTRDKRLGVLVLAEHGLGHLAG